MSARQTVTRVARSIRKAGEEFGGYFADVEDADTFEAELTYMLVNQLGAFNSPVWFNCGLAQEYGIHGRAVGSWQWNKTTNQIEEAADSYSRPQLSACFIQSVGDDLMDMADLVKREMRIFKFGSGTGTNFSKIRAEGEKLSSGGTSISVRRGRSSDQGRGRQRSIAAPRARSSRAARRAARPRWSASTWTIPTSSGSSTGRCAKSTRRRS